jgi:hypothetical protein
LITVRILIILGMFSRIKIAYLLCWDFFVSISILDCIVFLLDVIFGKVQFTVVILPDFFLELTRI